MNLFQLSILIGTLATLALGVMVFGFGPHRRTNQVFILLTILNALWLGFMGIAAFASSVPRAVFWIRQCSAVTAFIPVLVYWLRLTLLQRDPSWSVLLRKSFPWITAAFVLLALWQTPHLLITAHLPQTPMEIAVPVYGALYGIYAGFLVIALGTLAILFVRDMRRTVGIRRTEMQYILLACSCGFFSGVMLVLIANLTGRWEIGQLLPLTPIVFSAITAYGLATHRIMDAPNVIRRMIAISLSLLYLSTIYFLTWAAAAWVIPHLIATELPLAHLTATLAAAMSMEPLRRHMERGIDHFFGRLAPIDFGETMKSAGDILITITTVPDLLERFTGLLRITLKIEESHILLADSDGFTEQYVNPGHRPALVLSHNDPLVEALQDQSLPQPLVLDLIQRIRQSQVLKRTEQRMRAMKIATLVGIRSKGEIIGIMLLGPRAGSMVYGLVEQNILTGLGNQLAIALENAKLYTEVRNGRIYNELLLDYMVNGVIAADFKKRITVCNREAARIIGMDPAGLQDRPISALPQPLFAILDETYNGHAEIRDRQATLCKEGSEDTPVNAGATSLHSHTGEQLGALLVFNDLTAIHKLEQQIRRTDRLASLGTLSAGMAHEIKNPLVTVKTFTQLLPERFDDPEFRASFTELVDHEVRRIDTLVNQLLHFARSSTPSLRPVGLHALINNTLKLVGQPMKQRGITCELRLMALADIIMGDPDMLTQALVNFLFNAIECLESDGQVIISTHAGEPEASRQIVLTVADNGPGIPPENLQHVFDPFFTTKAQGTGLGLSVAHEIIQKHNGTVDVESIVGQGSAFNIRFTLIETEDSPST